MNRDACIEYYIATNGTDHLGSPVSLASIDETYTVCEITRLDTGATKPLGAGGLQGPQGPAGPTGPAGPPGPTGGGVTSVNVSGGTTGLSTSGGPITTSGTITACNSPAPLSCSQSIRLCSTCQEASISRTQSWVGDQ